MVVYADILFLVNFISAYVMLYLLGSFIVRRKIKKARHLCSSLLGAAGAVAVFTLELPLWASYFFRALSVTIMVFIAFFEQKRQLLSQIIWLLTISGMMLAAVTALAALSGKTIGIIIKSGIVYFDIPEKIFVPAFIVSYVAVSFFLRYISGRRVKKRYTVKITHNDKTITVQALFDSGNLLREPVTGKCVSILEWDEGKKLFGISEELSGLGQRAEEFKLWAVPFNSIGNQSGIIFAFLADEMRVVEEKKIIKKTFIGLYEGSLSKNKEYRALINAELI